MVVSHVLTDQEARTVCKDDVVFVEAFFDGGGGGDDDDVARSEAEGEYGTVLFGDTLEKTMER